MLSWLKGCLGWWPWMSKKRHEAEIERLKNEIRREENARADRLIAGMREELGALIDKLIDCSVALEPERSEMSVQIIVRARFDMWVMEQVLSHGNSQREIEHICEVLAFQIKRELLTANLSRFGDPRWGVPRAQEAVDKMKRRNDEWTR